MHVFVTTAEDADAPAITSLRIAVADSLTDQFGRGHWSSRVTETGVLRSMKTSRVLVARDGTGIIAALRLTEKRPWAIDADYFEQVHQPMYLVDMAVEPGRQGQGVGRRLLEEAKKVARESSSDAIRLDAYAGAAGAGPFYAKCGFREVGRVTYRGVPLIYYEVLL
jgi:GNAT superfamily N-acetyltransferase